MENDGEWYNNQTSPTHANSISSTQLLARIVLSILSLYYKRPPQATMSCNGLCKRGTALLKSSFVPCVTSDFLQSSYHLRHASCGWPQWCVAFAV